MFVPIGMVTIEQLPVDKIFNIKIECPYNTPVQCNYLCLTRACCSTLNCFCPTIMPTYKTIHIKQKLNVLV